MTARPEAWVYIDHRVDPGAPRPGYLERIVDRRRSPRPWPHRWIEFLRRWDPHTLAATHRQAQFAWPPRSLSELLADPGIVEDSTLAAARFGVPWPFTAAGWEQMTDVIAEAGSRGPSARRCTCLRPSPDRYPHHLPSALYRAQESEQLAEFLDHVEGRRVAARIRSHRAQHPSCWPAGRNPRNWPTHLSRHVNVPGIPGRHGDLDADPSRAAGSCTQTTPSTGSGGGGNPASNCHRVCVASAPPKWAAGRRRPDPPQRPHWCMA